MRNTLISMAALTVPATSMAAPVANLKINGDITPPTCTVNGSEQADLVYDLGAVSPALIPEANAGYNDLPSISNTLTVVCDAATYLTFKATDTYPNEFILAPGMNSNYRAHAFNLVDAAAPGKTVGGVSYRWKNVTADGQVVYLSRANDGDHDNGTWSTKDWIVKGATTGWTKSQQRYVDPAALDLIAAKEFSASISNSHNINYGYSTTYLLPKAQLAEQGVDLTRPVNYTGNTLLTFNFGI